MCCTFGIAQVSSEMKCSSGIRLSLSEDSEPGVLRYRISNPNEVRSAWIEVWDQPRRLLRQQISIKHVGEIDWTEKIQHFTPTPQQLYFGIFDPTIERQVYYCGVGEPPPKRPLLPQRGGTVSEVLVGLDPEQLRPDFESQNIQLSAGVDGAELTLRARDIIPNGRVLLIQREPRKRSGEAWRETVPWKVVENLPTEFVDLHGFKVYIPARDLEKPSVLAMIACNSVCEDTRATFDLPSYYGASSLTIQVMGKPSPVLDSVELIDPAILDPHVINTGAKLRLRGNNFSSETEVSVRNAIRPAQFVSDKELIVEIPPGYFAPNDAISVEDDEVHVSETRYVVGASLPQDVSDVPSTENSAANTLPEPYISSVSPYPIELMAGNDPLVQPINVYGKNFRPDVVVTARADTDMDAQQITKLKTEFISSTELRAWLPRDMWRHHQASFRFIVQTESGFCTADLDEDIDIYWK
jgi:hypothetical protein